MRKLNKLFFVVVAVLMAAVPVLAQAPDAAAADDNSAGLKAIAAGVGFAIAVLAALWDSPELERRRAKARLAIRARRQRFRR